MTTIKLTKGFSEGSFVVHKDTFCVTIGDDAGWRTCSPGCVQRHFRSINGGIRVSSVEAVARSLIAHDEANTDPLVTAMAHQYYMLSFKEDGGQTLDMMKRLHEDPTAHVRARTQCASRGSDCHNPFHRMLEPARKNTEQLYRRFLKLYERNPETALHGHQAHFQFRMTAQELRQCRNRFIDETCEAVGL